jgi:hypothetical protein
VTADTGFKRFFVVLIGVTAVAFNLPVLAFQGKLGFLVVIEKSLVPGDFLVAVLAFLAQSFKVRLVGLMAGIAIHWRFPMLFLRVMAVGAFDCGVRPLQGKVRESVVKRVLIQVDDVFVSSFMVGVTEFAFFFGNIFFQSVKSLFINNVFIHYLVAIPAQLVLRLLVEQGMAFGAFGFKLCVTLNNGTGHHKIFQSPCNCLRRRKHQ